MKFTEAQLEAAIIELLGEQGFPYVPGSDIERDNTEVLIKADLRQFLFASYAEDNITSGEIDSIVKQIESLPASDLYDSNKTFCKWLSDGFLLKREDHKQKDLYIQLVDYNNVVQSILPHLIQDVELPMVAEPQGAYSSGNNSTKNSNALTVKNAFLMASYILTVYQWWCSSLRVLFAKKKHLFMMLTFS